MTAPVSTSWPDLATAVPAAIVTVAGWTAGRWTAGRWTGGAS